MTFEIAGLPDSLATMTVARFDAQTILALLSGWPGTSPPHLLIEIDAANVHDLEALVSGAGTRLTRIARSSAVGSIFFSACVAMPQVLQMLAQPWLKRLAWGEAPPLERVPRREMRDKRESKHKTPLATASTGALLGIVDHGCPFAHRAFRNAAGDETRVLAIWDQDQLPDFPSGFGYPEGFGYGRHVTRADLKNWLPAAASFAGMDEADCYRRAEYGAMAGALTHGSHVLGLLGGKLWSPSLAQPAASAGLGFREVDDVAARADIVFVQLPRLVLESPSESGHHRCILDGLRYIVSCAGSNVQEIVAVVAYGTNLGSHDDSSLFVQAVDELIHEVDDSGKKLRVVFPSGNGHQDRSHARTKPIPRGVSAQFDWRIPPGNEAATDAEIWFDPHSRCVFKIKPPALASYLEFDLATVLTPTVLFWPTRAQPKLTLVCLPQKVGDLSIYLRVSPTGPVAGAAPTAPAGRWRIQFEARSAAVNEAIHIYLSWAGRNIGFPSHANQSQVLGESGNGHVIVDGIGTVIGSACGREVDVIGGYRGARSEDKLARAKYSARGPARNSLRLLPQFLALTDENAALPGVLGLGTRSGSVARMWGTSVAAPQAAREIAQIGTLSSRAQGTLPDDVDGGFLQYRP